MRGGQRDHSDRPGRAPAVDGPGQTTNRAAPAVSHAPGRHHDGSAGRGGDRGEYRRIPGGRKRAVAALARSSPSAVAARSAPAAALAPSSVARAFFAAIGRHDWQDVWRLGGKNLGEGPYAIFSGMISGYRLAERDAVTSLSASGDSVSGRFLAYGDHGRRPDLQLQLHRPRRRDRLRSSGLAGNELFLRTPIDTFRAAGQYSKSACPRTDGARPSCLIWRLARTAEMGSPLLRPLGSWSGRGVDDNRWHRAGHLGFPARRLSWRPCS